MGYACYGPIAVTIGSYDLYWIAVDQSCQGKGLGKVLLAEAERLIGGKGEGGSILRLRVADNTPPPASSMMLRLSKGGIAQGFLCRGG